MRLSPGTTVAEILKHKKASIKAAALDPGSPSWDAILHLTWAEVRQRAKRNATGFKTIKKLLGSREYDKMKKIEDGFRGMLALLRELREAKITYALKQIRDDALMIEVFVPGQRWEIEFVDYGDEVQVEIERFLSNGHIDDETALTELFAQFSDREDTPVSPHDPART